MLKQVPLWRLVLLCALGIAVVSFVADAPPKKSEFVHSVYFWLNDDVSNVEHKEFVALLQDFKRIKGAKKVQVGIPAGTPRSVVDNSYDVALHVTFKDKAGHDAYQEDEIHKAAIDRFEGWIADVKIYDSICEY